MRFPGPGDQRVGEGEDQGGAGKVRRRARQDGARRSLAASGDRPRDRPDHPARHGRAASGGDPGPHAHRVRCRRHHGRAAGRLSRDHHQEARPNNTSTRSRPAAPVSSRKCGSCSSRCARSTGFEFVDETVGGSVPKEYVPSVEKGLRIQKEDGVLAHYPTVDFRATLIDGSYHDVDSNALTFEIAAKACFREAIRKASPILLEPVMKVETVTPGDYLGDVIGDLESPPRLDPGPAGARHQYRRRRECAAVGNVRLHRPFAQHDQRPGVLYDGILALRPGAAADGRRGDRAGEQGGDGELEPV